MKSFEIAQPSPASPPVLDVYYACTMPGCTARYHLPRDQRMHRLDDWAAYHGWSIERDNERCPDHLPGHALQLPAASLDPTSTQADPLTLARLALDGLNALNQDGDARGC